MGLESIVSIIPAIGNVVGNLLKGIFSEGENASLHRYTFRVGTSVLDEVDITAKNGVLSLVNRTLDKNLCVSFPAQNGNNPQTAIVPPSGGNMKLNDYFKACAENDIDSFNLTLSNGEIGGNGLFAEENVITMSAGGTVKVGDPTSKFIGVYINVQLTPKDITIHYVGGKGKGEVVTLYLQSVAGAGSYYTHNVVMDADDSITIPHTLTLQDGEEVHVSATISYAAANHAKFMEDNHRKYGIRLMTQEELAEVSNAICVNRKG